MEFLEKPIRIKLTPWEVVRAGVPVVIIALAVMGIPYMLSQSFLNVFDADRTQGSGSFVGIVSLAITLICSVLCGFLLGRGYTAYTKSIYRAGWARAFTVYQHSLTRYLKDEHDVEITEEQYHGLVSGHPVSTTNSAGQGRFITFNPKALDDEPIINSPLTVLKVAAPYTSEREQRDS